MIKKMTLAVLLVLAASSSVFAQSTGTINGSILDATGAVVPGAAVTVTSTTTGVARNTATNGEGLYNIPALQPGVYDVKAESTGFAPSLKNGVTLVTATTLTLDFALGVAGTTQQVEVSGEAVMVETTRSEVSATMRVSEVQSLPILNRTFSGLVQVIPGARSAPPQFSIKYIFGNSISINGAWGTAVLVNVDGAANRDDLDGGTLFNYTMEGLQEFKILSHNFGAQYGRTSGGVVEVTTKSGTNTPHGSAFAYGRNDAMTAIDYFSNPSNGGVGKPPYSRVQFGGSFGGPIVKDKLFFYGAFERVQLNNTFVFPASIGNQAATAKQALTNLASCPACVAVGNAIAPSVLIPVPVRDNMYSLKGDYQLNNQHSLFVRWAQQKNSAFDDQFFTNNVPHPDLGQYSNQATTGNLYSLVASENWVIGNNSVNTLMFQRNHFDVRQFCDCGPPSTAYVLRNLRFPSIELGRNGPSSDQEFYQTKMEFKDDFAHQMGKHSLKFGGDFGWYPQIGLLLNIGTCGQTVFRDDPTTIVGNTNGKYPQGFATPGIIQSVTLGTCTAGGPQGTTDTVGLKQTGFYLQDDWKVTPRLTLNLGLRYDLTLNEFNQRQLANNRTYLVLKAIGNPIAASLPEAAKKNFAPRVGFAWDIGGNGKRVLRAGAGIFFDQWYVTSIFQEGRLEKPTLSLSSVYFNSAVGVGDLPNYVFGVSPLPPGPPAIATTLPRGGNTGGQIVSPGVTDPYNEQFHVGYSHQLTANTVLSVDYTHILGLHGLRSREMNPIEGPWDPNQGTVPTGTRRLVPTFQSVLGDPKILGGIGRHSSDGRSRYDELIVHMEHRAGRATFQVSYTLASAYGFGGVNIGIEGLTVPSQNPDLPFAPLEWGPSNLDERHRAVVSGVFAFPWGIQAAPIFQAASARPYTLTRGPNPTGAGNLFYIDPATGFSTSFNSQRGSPSFNFDIRVTKFFNLGKESRKLSFFGEFYNITNRANFGNVYNGSSLSVAFKKPIGYLAGYPTSRQLQLGARFSF